MTDSDGLNVTEAAAYVRLHRSTVSRLVAAGKIPHRMVGRVPRFSRLALSRWLAGQDEAAPEPLVRAPTGAPTGARRALTPKHVGRRGATLTGKPLSKKALDVVLGGRM